MQIQLWQNLMQIIGQIRGSQNIFGYKSTVANQLYLLYYFGGKIYFARKHVKHLAYLWNFVVSCQVLFTFAVGSYYLWLYDMCNDLFMVLNVASCIGVVNMSAVAIPLMTIWSGDGVEKMIEHVDNILVASFSSVDPDFKQNNIMTNAKKYLSGFLKPYAASAVIYLLICVIDIVLFFQPDKPINYLYYPLSPPMITRNTSLSRFFVVDSIVSLVVVTMIIQMWLAFGLILYWNVICCNELINIRNDLQATTSDLNEHLEEGKFLVDWDAVFERALRRTIEEYQKTTKLIDHLRGFVEVIGTILIITAFLYGVIFLHVIITTDLSWVLKVKCITGYAASAVIVFLLYTVGQNFDDSVFEITQVVYSTPWYRSTKHRKNVYILLCQTQSTKKFAIFGVYGLQYNNFSRYVHGLMSCINILRKLTLK